MEEDELTEQEDIYLILKHGPHYAIDLYYLWVGGARGLTELELKAAEVGKEWRIAQDKEVEDIISKELQEEIDNEILRKIETLARNEK
jgi:HKD family nuclease